MRTDERANEGCDMVSILSGSRAARKSFSVSICSCKLSLVKNLFQD